MQFKVIKCAKDRQVEKTVIPREKDLPPRADSCEIYPTLNM